MRIAALTLAIVLTSFAGAEAPRKTEWTTIELGDSKSQVQFPGKPTKKDETGGPQFLLETMGGKAVYLVTANPWPTKTDLTNKDFAKTMFDTAVGGLEKTLKGKKLSDNESRFADKYPSRDVDLEAPGIGIYRTKWVMTPTAFIQLVVAGPKEFVDAADAKKFIESLKIKD